VDLVIFAGDAYKDRSPAPTFQREWGRRIMRLSQAKIPTLLLIGNHDISPAAGRAHAIQEFATLEVPYVRVLDRPQLLGPDDLWGVPAQVIAMPWIPRSGLMASLELSAEKPEEIFSNIESRISDFVEGWLTDADPSLPRILTAHASVEGATFGAERMVMLGADLVLPTALVKDKRLDYVAMGHIHKPQNLNGPGPDPKDKTPHAHPPVIYPGSIERVDFGEARDDKFFIIAEVSRGETKVHWKRIEGTRPFIEKRTSLTSSENVTDFLMAELPNPQKMEGAIVKLVVEYPREWDTLIDESALRKYAGNTFEFHLVKRPQIESRVRIAEGQAVSSLSPLDLLEQYWRAVKMDKAEDVTALQTLAEEILAEDSLDE
jgi:exonuclease SbcD